MGLLPKRSESLTKFSEQGDNSPNLPINWYASQNGKDLVKQLTSFPNISVNLEKRTPFLG